MARIQLTRGMYAEIDDADLELVSRYSWYARQDYDTWYAATFLYQPKRLLLMHRLIMGVTDPNIRVDHRDRNGLNNRRSNLREATRAQNALNAIRPVRKHIPYRGVYKLGNRWRARANWDGVRFSLGVYDTMEEAARAYDAFNREHNAGFAVLNFPDEVPPT